MAKKIGKKYVQWNKVCFGAYVRWFYFEKREKMSIFVDNNNFLLFDWY